MSSAFSIAPQSVAGNCTTWACSGLSFIGVSAMTGSRTITTCPTVLTPVGVTIRTSRTPGSASAATVNFTSIFVNSGFFASSSGLSSGGCTSAVTPSPVTSTW